jgi:RNA polymerase sigma factor (TIGR02999 family)
MLPPPSAAGTNTINALLKLLVLLFGRMQESAQNITQLLKDWGEGNQGVLDELMPMVYDELRRQAARHLRKERPNHTLQTTALIHEAYLKLIGQEVNWQNRAHFFAIASQAMRRILVDHARTRHREKRGGVGENLPLEEALAAGAEGKRLDLVELDEALTRLAKLDERQAKIVELRYFSGLSIDETAEVLGVSNSTVRADWTMAKAWLKNEIGG